MTEQEWTTRSAVRVARLLGDGLFGLLAAVVDHDDGEDEDHHSGLQEGAVLRFHGDVIWCRLSTGPDPRKCQKLDTGSRGFDERLATIDGPANH